MHGLAPRPSHSARLITLLALFAITSIASAGPLDPPAGPIQSTGRTLDRIEPRICVNDLPGNDQCIHRITEPGQYYLAAMVRGQPGKHGIVIETPGSVSIDLNGFSVSGLPGALNAISHGGGGGRIAIHTSGACVIEGWPGAGVSAHDLQELSCSGFAVRSCDGGGLVCGHTEHFLCANITVEDCGGWGIDCVSVPNIVHRDIAARSCDSGGLRILTAGLQGGVQITLSAVRSSECGGPGALIQMASDGFEIDISGSSFSSNADLGLCIDCSDAAGDLAGRISLNDVACFGNAGAGYDLRSSAGTPVQCSCTHLRCVGNSGDGFTNKLSLSGVTSPGSSCVITNSDFSNNGGSGCVSVSPLFISNSTMGSNVLHGLSVSNPDPLALACRAVACVSSSNGAAGMRCGPGRFTTERCEISDCVGDGILLLDGCLLLTNTSVNRCGGDGVNVSGTLNIQGGAIRRNNGNGVRCFGGSCRMQDVVVEHNGAGGVAATGASFENCPSVGLSRCDFSNNNGDGVLCVSGVGPVRWMSPECSARNNSGNGFDLANCAGFELVDCIATGNGGVGIIGRGTVATGRIERCSTTGNGGGIHIAGSGCLIIGNSSSHGPLGAFSVSQGNTTGPIIDAAGVASSCNPRANVVY